MAKKTIRRRTRKPAGIRRRVEPDPVDVVLGDSTGAVGDMPPRDGDGDGDTSDTAPPTTPSPTATATPPGDDSPGRPVGDTARRQNDGDRATATPPGDGDRATRRQTRMSPTTTLRLPGDGDSADDGDNADAAPGEASATEGGSDTASSAESSSGSRDRQAAGRGGTGEQTAGPEVEVMKSRSFSMPPSLIRRMSAAQWHTQLEEDGYGNLSEFVRAVVDKEVSRLERTYNGGRPFPEVGRLPSGPSPEGAQRGADLRALKRQSEEGEGGRRRRRGT